MRNQKGITLVALVITIIVLLILAGVSISLVMGNNGVLTQASNAVTTNKVASVKEKLTTALASAETTYWANWAQNSSTTRTDTYGGATGNVYDELTANGLTVKITEALVGTSSNDNVQLLDGTDLFVFKVSVNSSTGKATIDSAVKVYEGQSSIPGSLPATPTTTITLK